MLGLSMAIQRSNGELASQNYLLTSFRKKKNEGVGEEDECACENASHQVYIYVCVYEKIKLSLDCSTSSFIPSK